MIVRDLSHRLTTGMATYPGDPQVGLTPALTVNADTVAVLSLHLGSHSGTHVDAPSHLVPGGATIDSIPLERFSGRARVLRVGDVAERQRIGVTDLDLASVGAGDIVLVATGWDALFGAPEYLDHPYLDAGVAQELLRRGVAAVGVDMLSPDETPAGSAPSSLPFHQVFLGAGGLIYENLTGLTSLPDTVTFTGMPLPLHAGDGSPVRAYATFADHAIPTTEGEPDD